MSGITDDSLHVGDVASLRLYDPAFKLFGRTIPMSSDPKDVKRGGEDEPAAGEITSVQDVGDVGNEIPESEDDNPVPDEVGSSSGSNDGCDEEKMVEVITDNLEDPVVHPAVDVAAGEAVAMDTTCAKKGHVSEEKSSLDQAPKKPDKPVPCPRCENLDTKFCYFNNYNVNQPRHFCKNCQRYWTAGGTLRNVPVGAGRRKNKHSLSNHRHASSDGFIVRGDEQESAKQLLSSPGSGVNMHLKTGVIPPNLGHLLPLDMHSLAALDSPQSSAVLSFGQESPVCVSTGAARRSEVLQGYKPEMSHVQAHHNLNNNVGTSPFLTGGENIPCEKRGREQNPPTSFSNELGGSTPLNAAIWQPSGTEVMGRLSEFSQLPMAPTLDGKPEVGGTNEFTKFVDAALAWASSAPFPLVGCSWPYGANLGWGNGLAGSPLINAVKGGAPTPSCNPAGGDNLPAAQPSCPTAMGPWPGAGMPWPPAAAQPSCPTAMGPWPGAGIPWPLLQNPLWAAPAWASAWTMPWVAPFMAAAAAAAAASASTAPAKPEVGCSVLGKHPREQEEANTQRGGSLLIPKTLRIDDPGEAARSSIWTTLGLELPSHTLAAGGLFGDLLLKGESRDTNNSQAQARNSNPAAFNRSTCFQENSMTAQK